MTSASLLRPVAPGVDFPTQPARIPARDVALRRDMRRQIAGMERQLGGLFASAFPRVGIDWTLGHAMHGPRILSTAELEVLRDELAGHLARIRAELGRRAESEQQRRRLIEAMVEDPAAHKWRLVSNEQIGEPGCRHWHSRPRLGVIGMIMGWWRVKISSGCPLEQGHGPRAAPR